MNRTGKVCFCGLAALLAFAGRAPGQQGNPPAEADDAVMRPTPYGIRLTPGMARAMGDTLAREVFVRRYELDDSKRAEAAEAIARRIMRMAHKNEENGQEFAEWIFTQVINQVRSHGGGPPPDFFKGLGERLLPMMPDFREMVNGVLRDVRPMLSLKQQLKMTADITMVNVGLDAFEKNLRRMASGEQVDPSGSPFENPEDRLKKDESGQTRALKNARSRAEARSSREPGAGWDQYVEEAKKYYELDSSQAAMADSLLRDYKERAKIAVGGEREWQARLYRNRLWWGISITTLPGRWNHPLRLLLDREAQRIDEPLQALGDELKERIEAIPTQAQRDAAERRIQLALEEKGLIFEEPDAVSTTPAATTGDE